MRKEHLRVAMTGNGFGYIVHIRDGQETVWASQVHLNMNSAKGFMSDLQDQIDNLACAWCGSPGREVDHFGDLGYDVSDILAFCDDPRCADERAVADHALSFVE